MRKRSRSQQKGSKQVSVREMCWEDDLSNSILSGLDGSKATVAKGRQEGDFNQSFSYVDGDK